MRLPAFVWPRRIGEDRTAPIRAGRVAHWIGAGAGIAAIGFGLALIVFSTNPRATDDAIGFIAFGVAAALLGRGVRYIAASE